MSGQKWNKETSKSTKTRGKLSQLQKEYVQKPKAPNTCDRDQGGVLSKVELAWMSALTLHSAEVLMSNLCDKKNGKKSPTSHHLNNLTQNLSKTWK
jgi:hypothetical protein